MISSYRYRVFSVQVSKLVLADDTLPANRLSHPVLMFVKYNIVMPENKFFGAYLQKLLHIFAAGSQVRVARSIFLFSILYCSFGSTNHTVEKRYIYYSGMVLHVYATDYYHLDLLVTYYILNRF